MSSSADRLREIPDSVLFAPNASAEPTPGHPLFGLGFSREELGREVGRRKEIQNQQAIAHNKAQTAAQNSQIAKAFAHLPPLPSRLPPDGTERATTSEALEQFYDDCAKGKLDNVQSYVDSESPGAEYLQYGLSVAAGDSRVEAMRFLLGRGCQFNSNVLEMACNRPSLEVFRLFVEELGWHPNQSMQSSGVALPSCVQNEELLRYLLDHGADPNLGAQYYNHYTPGLPTDRFSGEALEQAASYCAPHIVDLLLEYGAKLEYGAPLHCAAVAYPAQPGRRAMIHHLVDLGVDINGTFDKKPTPLRGKGTPLALVVSQRNQDAAALLLEVGAHPDTVIGEKPSWYVDLVEKVKWDKGDAYWDEVTAAMEKASSRKREQ